MNPRTSNLLIGVMVAATFITGILVYPHLPLMAASHWNAAGHATSSLPRFWTAFLFPILLLFLWGLWALLPRIDPIAPAFTGFRYVYDFFWILVIAFFAYVYALSLLADVGIQVNMFRAIIPALALLLVVAGALLPYIKRNWFFGIRTPWTLSSDAIWNKTHRFGSFWFELAGIISLAALFVPRPDAVWLIVVPLILAALVNVVYSYMLFARERRLS